MHVAKYTASAAGHMLNHYNRKDEKDCERSNPNIDKERTKDNVNLMQRDITPQEFYEKRLSEIYHMDRADVNTLVNIVVPQPKDYDGSKEEFFIHTIDFLNDRYGANNCVGAFLHLDESNNHLHYTFIPVVEDKNPKHEQNEKLCAKEVITRQDLRTLHPDLERHLREKMPNREINIYEHDKEKREAQKKQYTKETNISKAAEREYKEQFERTKAAREELEKERQAYQRENQKLEKEIERNDILTQYCDYKKTEKDFIERNEIPYLTYSQAIRDYEQTGNPVFKYSSTKDYEPYFGFISPEIVNPERSETEREALQDREDQFYSGRDCVEPVEKEYITHIKTEPDREYEAPSLDDRIKDAHDHLDIDRL